MNKLFATILVAGTLLASTARADLYMQNPRGSNNRQNDSSGSTTGSSAVDAVVTWIASLLS